MCVRNAYCCTECELVYPMPLGQSLGRRILCHWLQLKRDKQEPRTDILCKNQYCLRRTEEGYRLCLNMNEPCWFCFRYGHQELCGNRFLHLVCEKCFFASSDPASPPATRYPFPRNYRRLEQTKRDFLPTDWFIDDVDSVDEPDSRRTHK